MLVKTAQTKEKSVTHVYAQVVTNLFALCREGRHGIWYFNPFNFHGPPLSRMALCNLIEFSVKDVIILAV